MILMRFARSYEKDFCKTPIVDDGLECYSVRRLRLQLLRENENIRGESPFHQIGISLINPVSEGKKTNAPELNPQRNVQGLAQEAGDLVKSIEKILVLS